MAEVRKGRLGYEDTLNFVNSLCLTYILCSAVLRGWIRRGIYGLDDTMVAFATVLSLAFSASVYVALAHGAGKPWQSITSAGDSNAYNQVGQTLALHRTTEGTDSHAGFACCGHHVRAVALPIQGQRCSLPRPNH